MEPMEASHTELGKGISLLDAYRQTQLLRLPPNDYLFQYLIDWLDDSHMSGLPAYEDAMIGCVVTESCA